MKLSDYILLSREERLAHIDLSTPCEIVPSTRFTRDKRFDFFGIENDVADHRRAGINRCHLCENGQNGGTIRICHNPLHFYIGTMSENTYDISKEKRGAGGRATKGVKRTLTEEHIANMRHPKTPRKKMRCLVTGHVTDSGHLTRFQKARNIDTSLREPVQ